MKNIEVKVLNPWSVLDAEQMLMLTARITQRSEKIADLSDFHKFDLIIYYIGKQK